MSSHTVTFSKQDFIHSLAILGFIHLSAIDKTENKQSLTYVHETKGMYVEIKVNPFQIRVRSRMQYFVESSYERAYNLVHGTIT